MTEPQPPVRAYVARRGVTGYAWTAYCTDRGCRARGPQVHTTPETGAVAVNTQVGNRTVELAILAATLHLARCHPLPT